MHAVSVAGPIRVLILADPALGRVGRFSRALLKNSQIRAIVDVGFPTLFVPPELTKLFTATSAVDTPYTGNPAASSVHVMVALCRLSSEHVSSNCWMLR